MEAVALRMRQNVWFSLLTGRCNVRNVLMSAPLARCPYGYTGVLACNSLAFIAGVCEAPADWKQSATCGCWPVAASCVMSRTWLQVARTPEQAIVIRSERSLCGTMS